MEPSLQNEASERFKLKQNDLVFGREHLSTSGVPCHESLRKWVSFPPATEFRSIRVIDRGFLRVYGSEFTARAGSPEV
jgi:hypothetical protein